MKLLKRFFSKANWKRPDYYLGGGATDGVLAFLFMIVVLIVFSAMFQWIILGGG